MDLVKQMSLEFDRNLSIVKKHTRTGIISIFEQLKIALDKLDSTSVVFCVDEICKWYHNTLPGMRQNSFTLNILEQEENSRRFCFYQEQLKTYDFSQAKKTLETANQSLIKTKLFISHSSKDEKIIRQLETFLRGLGIAQEFIFCSSIEGQGVKNGERIEEKVRNTIKESKLLLYVLSQNFMASTYCVQELGAGWIMRDYGVSTFLIKLEDLEYGEIKGFVNFDFKCCELNDDNLDELIDNTREIYQLPNASSTENKKLKKAFLSAIQGEIESLKQSAKISKEEQAAIDKKCREEILLACNDAERNIITTIYKSKSAETSLNHENAVVQILTRKGIIFNGARYFDLLEPKLSYTLMPWVYETLKANETLKTQLIK